MRLFTPRSPSGASRPVAWLVALLAACCGASAMAQQPGGGAAPATPAGADAERAAVMAPVQALFDFITSKDVATGQAALLADARVVAVRRSPEGKQVVRGISSAEFIKAISEAKGRLVERYWAADVRVQGSVAAVSTAYDFWRDGQFSHCGTNLLQLVRTDEGWRISSITYSAITQGCEASPLGPLGPLKP